MDEPPENETLPEMWTRVQRNLQEAILTSYPNPNRVGCPGTDEVRRLAMLSLDLSIELEDAEPERWEHITHCSPCYKEYLDIRAGLKKKSGK
jgi:hypothetical protein